MLLRNLICNLSDAQKHLENEFKHTTPTIERHKSFSRTHFANSFSPKAIGLHGSPINVIIRGNETTNEMSTKVSYPFEFICAVCPVCMYMCVCWCSSMECAMNKWTDRIYRPPNQTQNYSMLNWRKMFVSILFLQHSISRLPTETCTFHQSKMLNMWKIQR